jgi:hypothetical protein
LRAGAATYWPSSFYIPLNMLTPTCPSCKVRLVRLHDAAATDTRSGRTYFECPSCFAISSEPLTYVFERAAPSPQQKRD